MKKISVDSTSSGNLDKAVMLTGIEILSLAVHDVPDIEIRLFKAKERMLFNQPCNHPKVKQIINLAHKNLVTQIEEFKKTQNLQSKEQNNG